MHANELINRNGTSSEASKNNNTKRIPRETAAVPTARSEKTCNEDARKPSQEKNTTSVPLGTAALANRPNGTDRTTETATLSNRTAHSLHGMAHRGNGDLVKPYLAQLVQAHSDKQLWQVGRCMTRAGTTDMTRVGDMPGI